MSFVQEFKPVEMILTSGVETSGVDAFALSLIKAERQMRKLFTYLAYQSPDFTPSDIPSLIAVLASRVVYFNGLVSGVDALSPVPIRAMVGSEYKRLLARLNEFRQYRNKIFHGQLTGESLGTEDLRTSVSDIKLWCQTLAGGATRELGYDGFARDSFKKDLKPALTERMRVHLRSVDQYGAFIAEHMEHPKRRPKRNGGLRGSGIG